MRRKLKENIFHINNRKGFRKPLNYLRQNHIYCRNNEYKRYEFINTTDMDSMISSVSFNDYQFALDCMNTSDSSSSSSSNSGTDTVVNEAKLDDLLDNNNNRQTLSKVVSMKPLLNCKKSIGSKVKLKKYHI